MEEIIRLENIQVNIHADTWEEAIKAAGSTLVACGSITEQYLDNCISSVKELGPYIILMPYLALAHSAPCDAVKTTDLSIATFDQDIWFDSDHDPVRIILCLACTDKESHINRLSKIAEMMMEDDRDLISEIKDCTSAEALYSILNKG